MIYKKGEIDSIANYRPITLLNTDYKIIAKVYANRLKKIIQQVVGENQRGFIPNRDIRTNIIEAKSIINLARFNQILWRKSLIDREYI